MLKNSIKYGVRLNESNTKPFRILHPERIDTLANRVSDVAIIFLLGLLIGGLLTVFLGFEMAVVVMVVVFLVLGTVATIYLDHRHSQEPIVSQEQKEDMGPEG